MKKVILWLLAVFFSILILSSLMGSSYEGFQEGATTAPVIKPATAVLAKKDSTAPVKK